MIAQSIVTKTRHWMIEDLELAKKTWLGLWRQNTWVILIPLVLGPLIGFLLSYAFKPKYTSQALLLVESQTAPQGSSQSATPEAVGQRIARLWQPLSQSRLEPIVEETDLSTRANSVEQAVKQIRENTRIYPAPTDLIQNNNGDERDSTKGPDLRGFYVDYTGSSPTEAQRICNELTLTLLQENLNSWQPVTENLAETLRQLDDAKRNLDEHQAKLTSFNNEHMGQPAGDREKNESVLLELNARQKQISQTIKQAQEDQSHTESLLAQQQATNRKPEPTPISTVALEKQLSRLQSQLIQLEAQYADNHPDVIKTKTDISDIEKNLQQANDANAEIGKTNTKPNVEELPEIRQLRLQIDRYSAVIAEAKREQKRIQEQIKAYQRRGTASSSVEKQQRRLVREYSAAQDSYDELLVKKSDVKNKIDMNAAQPADMIRMLRPANLPAAPSFPNRMLFAATGCLVSVTGVCLALTLKARRKRLLRKGLGQAFTGLT
jgi:polysaccharide biosynthesis transport protein